VRVCVCVRALSVCVFKCCCPAEGAGGQAPVVGNVYVCVCMCVRVCVCVCVRFQYVCSSAAVLLREPEAKPLLWATCVQCLVTQRHQKKARKRDARHISCRQVLVHLVPQTAPSDCTNAL